MLCKSTGGRPNPAANKQNQNNDLYKYGIIYAISQTYKSAERDIFFFIATKRKSEKKIVIAIIDWMNK
jgi:hypothetical protein